MFNPFPHSLLSAFSSPKLPASLQQIRRLLSQNLTVLSLDLLSHCIVFKDRRCRSNRCSRDNVDYYNNFSSPCQPFFASFFAFNTVPDIPSFSRVIQVNTG